MRVDVDDEDGRPRAAADAAGLAASVLSEEARRVEEAALPGPDLTGGRPLPGVGGEAMELRDVVRAGGPATIGVLFGLNLVDELDTAAFAVLGPDIQDTLGLSDTLLALTGAMGGFVVFMAAIPLGYLADRSRRMTLLGACTALWAAFALLTGLVRSTGQLVLARLLIGVGKANVNPVQKAVLADAYPIEGRTRVFALHNAANGVGLLLGPAAAGLIAVAVGGDEGWRWAFPLLALPAALLALVVTGLPEPRRGRNEQLAVLGEELETRSDELPVSVGAAFRRLRAIQTFRFTMAALGAIGFGLVAAPLFVNLVLEDEFGLDAGGRGLVGTITAAGALIGLVVGGSYGDRLFREAPERTMLLAGGALAVLGVSMPLSLYMPNAALYTLVGFASSATIAAAFVPSSAVIAAVTPYRLRSMGFALVGIYLSLVGATGGALVVGGLSDRFGPRTAVTIAVPLASFLGGGLMAWGARYVRHDMAMVVTDLDEEREERARVAAGGTVPVLQVRNLDFSYGQVQVLFDVGIDVYPGEVLALLGTNGAGKSTLLKVVSGIGLPERGVVRLDGRSITFAEPRQRVRMGIVHVPGGKGVFPTLTVRENLIAGAYTYVWNTAEVQRRVDEVLALFPRLGERFDQPAGTLSGGERQMLAIAMGLLVEPRILLLDELSLGLAPVVVQELMGVVEALKRQGTTMVIVEQSVNVALALADRAVFMEKGQVRFEGPAQDLLERDDLVRAVFLGGAGG